MKEKDYLIVGGGLAGLSFAQFCEQHEKSFVLYDGDLPAASAVAGGMYNPVVLKRFTSIWESKEQLDLAKNFYTFTEQKINKKYFHSIPIYRKFASVEGQNNWYIASDKIATAEFLNPKIIHTEITHIPTPFAYGEVYDTGFLEVGKWVEDFKKYIKEHQQLIEEDFIHDKLTYQEGFWHYGDSKFKYVIFAEGFAMNSNPYFNILPLDGTKGELLLVKIKGLQLENIVKSKVFLIPLGDDVYKVGATYDWKDKTTEPTKDGREELEKGLKELVQLPYEILEHKAGIRPTVNDRRPLVGSHFKEPQMYLLNGLGTRGVLLAPYLAKALFEYIEKGEALDKEIDIKRYYDKFKKQKKI